MVRASPDEESAQFRGHHRDSKNMNTLIHSNKVNTKWLWLPNDIRGSCEPKISWHLSYRWGKIPKITSPRKPVPTGDRTRDRCLTGAHTTACSTAVDSLNGLMVKILSFHHKSPVFVSRSLHCGRNGVRESFSRSSNNFPYTNFIPPLSPLSPHTSSILTHHPTLWWCVKCGQQIPSSITDSH